MKFVGPWFWIVGLAACLLSACNGESPVAAAAELPSSTAIHTNTPLTPTITTPTPKHQSTVTPSPSPTLATVEPPCDQPVCIYNTHSLLDQPFPQVDGVRIDKSYRYGSTQGGEREPHHGVEFMAQAGTPIHAAGTGTVVVAGPDNNTLFGPYKNLYGNLVIIRHEFAGLDQPVFSVYGHLSVILVKPGQQVKTGDVIGKVGNTGSATGPHLHFEVRFGEDGYGDTRNPELWLKTPTLPDGQQTGILAGRIIDGKGRMAASDNLTIQQVDAHQHVLATYYPETYDLIEKYPVNPDDLFRENFMLSGLEPGSYRVSIVADGTVEEAFVEVTANRVTVVTLTIHDN